MLMRQRGLLPRLTLLRALQESIGLTFSIETQRLSIRRAESTPNTVGVWQILLLSSLSPPDPALPRRLKVRFYRPPYCPLSISYYFAIHKTYSVANGKFAPDLFRISRRGRTARGPRQNIKSSCASVWFKAHYRRQCNRGTLAKLFNNDHTTTDRRIHSPSADIEISGKT